MIDKLVKNILIFINLAKYCMASHNNHKSQMRYLLADPRWLPELTHVSILLVQQTIAVSH